MRLSLPHVLTDQCRLSTGSHYIKEIKAIPIAPDKAKSKAKIWTDEEFMALPDRGDQVRPNAEQRIWLENISWQTFEQLLEDVGDRRTLKEFRQWVSDNLKKS